MLAILVDGLGRNCRDGHVAEVGDQICAQPLQTEFDFTIAAAFVLEARFPHILAGGLFETRFVQIQSMIRAEPGDAVFLNQSGGDLRQPLVAEKRKQVEFQATLVSFPKRDGDCLR